MTTPLAWAQLIQMLVLARQALSLSFSDVYWSLDNADGVIGFSTTRNPVSNGFIRLVRQVPETYWPYMINHVPYLRNFILFGVDKALLLH